MWTSIPGAAGKLAAGGPGTGQIYALGTVAVGGNYPIFRYVGGSKVWQSVQGSAVDLTVDSTGALWALQANNTIFTCTNCME